MNFSLLFFTLSILNPSTSFSGPVEIYYTSDGHFRIFYTLSGEDAVPSADNNPQNGIPDYIDMVADGATFAWQKIIDEYAWRSPGLVDIYIQKMAGGSSSGNSIFMSNELFTSADIGTLIAHEFMHTVQDTYDDESPWWKEATAEWMSHLLYGLFEENILFFSLQLNLMDRLGKNHLSLYDYRMSYANSLWVWFLQEWAGNGDQAIIRRIWERAGEIPGENTLESMDYILKERGSNLLSAFQEFTVWNYFLGPNDDGRHYQNGGEISTPYGSVKIDSRHEMYPVIGNSLNNPYPLGVNYIELIPDPIYKGAEMEFAGESGVNWGISIVFFSNDGGNKTVHERADERGHYYTVFPDWGRFNKIIIAIQNLNTSGEVPATYNYEIKGGDFHEEDGCGCNTSKNDNPLSFLILFFLFFHYYMKKISCIK